MKTFSIFYCLLYATWTEGGKIIQTEGFEGGQVSFQSSHKLASIHNKYFCKDQCREAEDVLVTVKPGGRAASERITLVDSGDGVFTVTFSQLKISDSGKYWCAVARPGMDSYTEVNLTVIQASESTSAPQTVIAKKTTVIPDISPTWTYPHVSSSTLTSDLGTGWPRNQSTASNDTNPGEQRMSMSTGTALYAAVVPVVVPVVVLCVLVLATMFRNRREVSKPPTPVCSNSKDLIRPNGGELECEYDDIDQEMPSNKICSTAQHIKQDPPALVSTEAECSIPVHIYENLSCSRATAGSRRPAAANHQNNLEISSGIKPLPPIISERTHDDRFRKHTHTPAAMGSAMSKAADIYSSPPSSDPSRSESMPTSLWFGLDLSRTS